MIERRRSVPVREPRLGADREPLSGGTSLWLLSLLPELDKGSHGLEASVVRAGVDLLDGRLQGDEVKAQLLCLLDSMGRQRWVCRKARRGSDGGRIISR
jgi:hypothetical protein